MTHCFSQTSAGRWLKLLVTPSYCSHTSCPKGSVIAACARALHCSAMCPLVNRELVQNHGSAPGLVDCCVAGGGHNGFETVLTTYRLIVTCRMTARHALG